MEDELSLDNLFLEDNEDLLGLHDEDTQEEESEKEKEAPPKESKSTEVTEETEESSESVGNEGLNIEDGESTSSEDDGASPNLYTSITKVLRDEGTFADLTDEECDKVVDVDSFMDMVNDNIHKALDARYQRIDDALNAGVQPDLIKSYEKTIAYLNGLTEEDIEDENNTQLRHDLIIRDMLNKGYSPERAEKWYKRSFDAGNEVDDAIEALNSNKEFFTNSYNDLVKEAKEAETKRVKQQKEQAAALKKSIMEDKELYGSLDVDKPTRQKIYDAITKPVHTDKDTGNVYTAVQKFQKDDPNGFMKVVGLAYILTKGGKDFSGLIKNSVKKEVTKSRQSLERAINNTSRDSSGNLRFVGSTEDDDNSFFNKFDLDV